LDEREEDSQSKDQEPIIIGAEDQEIEEKKPPNDKISVYRIVEENLDKTDS